MHIIANLYNLYTIQSHILAQEIRGAQLYNKAETRAQLYSKAENAIKSYDYYCQGFSVLLQLFKFLSVNSLLTSRLVHSYHLDESISSFWGVLVNVNNFTQL